MRRRRGQNALPWGACAGGRRSQERRSSRSSRRAPNMRSKARSGRRSPAKQRPWRALKAVEGAHIAVTVTARRRIAVMAGCTRQRKGPQEARPVASRTMPKDSAQQESLERSKSSISSKKRTLGTSASRRWRDDPGTFERLRGYRRSRSQHLQAAKIQEAETRAGKGEGCYRSRQFPKPRRHASYPRAIA